MKMDEHLAQLQFDTGTTKDQTLTVPKPQYPVRVYNVGCIRVNSKTMATKIHRASVITISEELLASSRKPTASTLRPPLWTP